MNISHIHNCFGCGVCAVACGKKIINIDLNADGFYEPHIVDLTQCTDCGICTDVCSYLHDDLALRKPIMYTYAAWSKDNAVRRKCSSGGVGFEVGKILIERGYKVCGVRYNSDEGRAEHYIASTIDELIPSIGSKYIQSYTVNGFKSINKKEKYLVTGTPCQIDSFRRYIQKFHCEDNFILLDFFCHGVPSKLMWDKYVFFQEKKVGKLTHVAWRHKDSGWHDSWAMAIDGKDHGEAVNWHDSYQMLMMKKKSFLLSKLSQGDWFYRMFLTDTCLGKACYHKCRFKYNQSSADIRIGDAWGKAYKHDDKGTSAAIAFTERGKDVLQVSNCELTPCEMQVIAEGQQKKLPTETVFYRITMILLRNPNTSIKQIQIIGLIAQQYSKLKYRLLNPKRTIRKLKMKILK